MIGLARLPDGIEPETINTVTDDLRAAVAEYESAIKAATQKRDDAIRTAYDRGMRPKDIEDETGYSRETIRQILLPEDKREELRARRRKAAK